MFNFFRKLREAGAARDASRAAYQTLLADVAAGRAPLLEAAIVLCVAQNNLESIERLIETLAKSEIFTINKGPDRLTDAAITTGPGGHHYLAAYTTHARATAAAATGVGYDRCTAISPLEAVYALGEGAGIVLNPCDPHLSWTFTPEQVTDLRRVYALGFPSETGGIYTVWIKEAYRCAKILKTDEEGVHIRVYANTWPERPSTVDPGTLALDSGAGESGVRSYGHLPFTRPAFLALGPKLAASATVAEDEELEGYNIWQEANGGYFTSSLENAVP